MVWEARNSRLRGTLSTINRELFVALLRQEISCLIGGTDDFSRPCSILVLATFKFSNLVN